METTQQQAKVVLSAAQVDAILVARRALKAIVQTATDRAWSAPSSYDGTNGVYAQDFGRLAGIAHVTDDALFDVLNTASAYCDCTEAQRGIAEWNEEE